MYELKYIIIDNLFPIIFPIHLNHKDIASNYNVTSAGFIDHNGVVYGYSDSLNMGYSKNDQKIINKVLRCSYQKM